MKINGKQLQDAIRILSKNYDMGYLLNAVFSQLTTKQLGEVLRYMLNDVKYNKELNEEDSLTARTPLPFDNPSIAYWESWGNMEWEMEGVLKQQIKDMIDNGKTIEQIKTFINDNTGVHIN